MRSVHVKTASLIVIVSAVCYGQAVAPVPDQTFEFHSGFWMNLDHFLREQAAVNPSPEVAPGWTAAVDYYRKNLIRRETFSDDAIALNNGLSDLGGARSLKDSGLNPDLIAILDAAAPIYRERWWPAHDRGNRAWIQAVSPLLAKYSADLKRDLGKAYGIIWPSAPIRTDVVENASSLGAYTSNDPPHITISSADVNYQGDAALEMLFHEGSHTTFSKIQQSMQSEARAQNRLYRRRDLWHAVLFYTAGTMVERRIPGYTQYAIKNGVFERGWPGAAEMLDKDWKPYLDGQIDLSAAIRRMITDYGVDAPKAPGR